MVGKVPGPNGILNRALKRLPQRAVSLLARMFNAILRTHDFLGVLKHAWVIYILKKGTDLALLSSYRPISLLDTTGKLFEKDPINHDPKLSKRARAGTRWAVWVSTQAQHVLAAGPSCWKNDLELWQKEANRSRFPWRGQILRYRLDRCPPL